MNAVCLRYLVVQTVVGTVLNAVGNGVVPWYVLNYLGYSPMPLFGKISVLGDIIGMAFVLPFLVCLIVTQVTYRDMRRGKVGAMTYVPTALAMIVNLPQGIGRRCLIIGTICTILAVPIFMAPPLLMGYTEIDLLRFCIAKAILAGVLAAVATWLAASRAMLDPVAN